MLDFNVPSQHLIAQLGNPEHGQRLLCFGGIHGNEPEGIIALHKVVTTLKKHDVSLQGELIAIAGNLPALKEGRRYLERDLNRNFSGDVIDLGVALNGVHSIEDHLARAILENIEPYLDSPKQTTFLDLHSTSAPGGGFSVLTPGERNEAIGHWLSFPVVFGLDKKLEGTLMGYLYNRGLHGLAFEGGRMGESSTVENHEAAIWTSLLCTGLLTKNELDRIPVFLDTLSAAAAGLPKSVALKYRYAVNKDSSFAMLPGFSNFQKISKGEILAKNDTDKVLSPMDGMILMPLYQSEGEDGFFIVEGLE